MKQDFVSNFAERLIKFFEQKQALGYLYNRSKYYDFKHFDQMCVEHFPYKTELTADICNTWATRRGNESPKTTARRLTFLREFARYLNQTGEQAYILPYNRVKYVQRYIPHIYSEEEIARLWRTFDEIPPTKAHPAAHIILPTIIRLVYCCGLRPSEALNLRINDVDIKTGKLFIIDSKGHRDRIVMLADDVCELCVEFDKQIRDLIPDRHFFFAKNSTEACNYGWLSWMFNKVREKLQLNGNGDIRPRLYDLRHSFATHRLYQWMKNGEDLNTKLPYLSIYMGHKSLTETFHYIHLVPGMFETMSGFQYRSATDIFPEVVTIDE